MVVEKISTSVSVLLFFDHVRKKVYPRWIIWNRRLYPVTKVGFHHTYREGKTLYHVFSVVSKSIFFRLVLNSENLHWRLEEISDGLAGI